MGTTTPATLPSGPFIAGGFALLTAIGTTQTWARALFISLAGTESDRGVVTLLAALAAVALCAGRLFFALKDRWYYRAGMMLGVVMITMPGWFLWDILAAEPEPEESLFGGTRIITASFPLYMTIAAAIAYTGCLAWQYRSAYMAATLAGNEVGGDGRR